MRVVDLIVLQLRLLGVSDIFSVTGGASAWLNDAFHSEPGVACWFFHHEQAAVMAAESYARRTGGVGVAVVTVGPGATNAVTGVAGAWADSIPVLILSGQSFSNQTVQNSGLRQWGIQETDIIPVVQSITKKALTLKSIDDVGQTVVDLFNLACEGRPGPVWLEIPADVQKEQTSTNVVGLPTTREVTTHEPDCSEVFKALLDAKRPLVHIGHGARISGSHDELISLLERHRIPFVTTHNAIDVAPTSHELNLGFPGIFGQRAANFAVECCDVYLSLGVRLTLSQTGYNPQRYANKARKFVVDIDAAELQKPWLSDWTKIQSDVGDVVSALQKSIPKGFTSPESWLIKTKELTENFPHIIPEVRADDREGVVNSYLLEEELYDHCEFVDTFITDMGLSYQSTMQGLRLRKSQRLYTNTGLASMGWGLPGAIGACIGSNRQMVVLQTGDGGLMMNLQELATLSHHNLPVLIIVFNNGGYLTQRQSQEIGFDARYTGVDSDSGLGFPDFVAIARSFGIPGFSITKLEDLREFFADVKRLTGPMLLDVKMSLDQMQAPKAVNLRDSTGRLAQTELTNLWPQLSEEVVASALSVS